jgi:hypothetical protein
VPLGRLPLHRLSAMAPKIDYHLLSATEPRARLTARAAGEGVRAGLVAVRAASPGETAEVETALTFGTATTYPMVSGPLNGIASASRCSSAVRRFRIRTVTC